MKDEHEYTKIANKFETLSLNGRTHVVSSYFRTKRHGSIYPEPNYLGSKKALIGIITTTLSKFKEEWINRKVTISQRALLIDK